MCRLPKVGREKRNREKPWGARGARQPLKKRRRRSERGREEKGDSRKAHTREFRVRGGASRAQQERILTFSAEGCAFVEEGEVGDGAVASLPDPAVSMATSSARISRETPEYPRW